MEIPVKNIVLPNLEIVTAFGNTIINLTQSKTCLLLEHNEFSLFREINTERTHSFNLRNDPFPASGVWDVVFGDFPFGMPTANRPGLDSRIHSYSVASTMKALPFIGPGGYGIFSLEPMAIFSSKNSLRELLEPTDFSIVAILNMPEGFWKHTTLRSILVVIKKCKVDKEFIGELETVEQAKSLAENFFSSVSGLNLSNGVFVGTDNFYGFNNFKIELQIKALESEYKNFTKRKLSDVVIAVNFCKSGQSFTHIPNSVYLPNIGTQKATSDLARTVIKHHNYFQIVCKPEVVEAEYLAAFFDSKLGRLIVDSLRSGSWIPKINKAEVLKAEIAIPDLGSQREIVATIKKLGLIKEKISSFENELAVSPISSKNAKAKIDSMLGVVDELADADKIKEIIRSGESKQAEFKETLSLDVKKQSFVDVKQQSITKPIETSSIKTIGAFLNSDGGVLLIGIGDSGRIAGVEKEIEMFHETKDRFLLHFKNLIKNRIGEQFYPLIDQRLTEVDGKLILFVQCQRSPTAVYVDDVDFYVRTNPATDKLVGPKVQAYIENHFKH